MQQQRDCCYRGGIWGGRGWGGGGGGRLKYSSLDDDRSMLHPTRVRRLAEKFIDTDNAAPNKTVLQRKNLGRWRGRETPVSSLIDGRCRVHPGSGDLLNSLHDPGCVRILEKLKKCLKVLENEIPPSRP